MKFFLPLFLVFIFTGFFSNFSLYSRSIIYEDSIQKRSTDIVKKVLPDNNVSYRFFSNRLLVPERIQAWENRFKITYNELMILIITYDTNLAWYVL